jgi:hypothetical protein
VDADSLLAKALASNIQELARAKHLDRARVATKVNAKGELVIALILPPDPMQIPPPESVPRRRVR